MENKGRRRWYAYTIRSRGERSFWIRIGAAFLNKDGSFNVYLDAMPLDGKLQIREAREQVEAGSEPSSRFRNGEHASEAVEA